MVAFAFTLLLTEVLLTAASWGLVGFWVSTGACTADEYSLFMGLWTASLVIGITNIAIAWGSQIKVLAALMLIIFFGILMLWVDYGQIVVDACPIGGA
jgi:hypothetical protein